jgi:AcrR family transcriptional regulator
MDCQDEYMAAKKPGRPRNFDTGERILNVTLRHLAEEGYSRMSLDGIAAEAEVSKPTIYRRWKSKEDLATAAIRTIQLAEPTADTGSTATDLIATLKTFRRSLLRPNGMSLVGTVLAEEEHTPELLAFFRERLVAPRREMLRAILERAAQKGELLPDVNLDATVTLLVGAFYARYLAASNIPESFVAELVKIVWRGIARKSSTK